MVDIQNMHLLIMSAFFLGCLEIVVLSMAIGDRLFLLEEFRLKEQLILDKTTLDTDLLVDNLELCLYSSTYAPALENH